MSVITYERALRDALHIAMEKDDSVFAMGIGADDHKAIFGSTKDALDRFGPDRVFDTPLSEQAMTGVAIGAALNGFRPIHIHIRTDFVYLAMDQIFNMAAKWRYMFGGQMNVPIVIRAVIGRSWGQGAQHSQSLQAIFMHVSGVKVVMPTTPYDAKGLLLASIFDPNPVVMIEHRLLYYINGEVPDGYYEVSLDKAVVRRKGKDLTIVANSYMVVEALKAAEFLAENGVDVEIIDPIVLEPLDHETICNSVRKTGKLLIIDSSWTTCGASAEIAAIASEQAFPFLKQPIRRMGMEKMPCPVSKPLENVFYPSSKTITAEVFEMMGKKLPNMEVPMLTHPFKGPF